MMKKLISGLAALLFVSVVYISTGAAQETAPKMIRGGLLNGKAISLPKPAYPEEAKKDKAEGRVSVSVTIDEEGNVIDARALAEFTIKGADGVEETKQVHPALQEASEKAAWGAKFSPTKLSGQPVKVTGTIVYNFVGPSPADEKPTECPVTGGVLNGKAVSLPAPVYPETARAVRAEGIVNVQVSIDETGNVVSANAVSGHPLLRAASVEAAKRAQFSPTMLGGQAVKVQGILTYKFVAPDK